MTDLEERLRAAMESAVASEQPPGNWPSWSGGVTGGM